ncbi:MAG: hypothetical protein JW751_14075 [Polyangiaceae bacterium]|nr:hypothetical protein [Polyangiaceae bacterium]
MVMGRDDRIRPGEREGSIPPETGEIDEEWGVPDPACLVPSESPVGDEIDIDSMDNRITAIPSIPMAELAAGLLAETDHDAIPTIEVPSPPPSDAVGLLSSSAPRGTGPSLRDSLSSPHLPRIDYEPPSAESLPEPEVPPSWTEPDLELPLSSSSELPVPTPPAAERGADAPLELDFDSVFADTPKDRARSAASRRRATSEPGGARSRSQSSRAPPPRDELPTLDLAQDVPEERPTRRRSPGTTAATRTSEPVSAAGRASGLPVRLNTGIELKSDPPPRPERTPYQELHDRYAVGDFTGALVVAEALLEQEPEDLEAARFAQSCRDVLTQMYSARVGALDAPVRVAIPPDQIRWLSLDHRAGFLLSLVDGVSTVEEILDICGMPRLDALRLLFMLLEERVVVVERRGR